jgi:hypothetical protein
MWKPEDDPALVTELKRLTGRPDPIVVQSTRVPGPSALYVTRADQLYLRSFCSQTGVVLMLRARVLQPDGEVVQVNMQHTPASDRSAVTTRQDLGEGYLLGLAVNIDTGSARRGALFVQAGLVRGGAVGSEFCQTLVADALADGQHVGWPGGRVIQSVDGPGFIRRVTGTNPAAGSEISETVPTNARWKLRGVAFALVTSAAVANRRVHLIIDDGAAAVIDAACSVVQTASLTRTYFATAWGYDFVAQDSNLYIDLPPDLVLFQGWRVRTATTLLDVGDDFGPPGLYVEESPEE